MGDKIILGTRGSELARTQCYLVETALRSRWPDIAVETKVITTSGDEKPQPTVDRAGRKGLFTAEIERALVRGEIDVAVHSAKDLPSDAQPETEIAAVLPRAAAGDALVAMANYDLQNLPSGAIVATGSVRRQHQLRWKRPDLEIVDLRGNVPTRLRKLVGGQWHAIVLAQAGLDRLALKTATGTIRYEGADFFAQDLSPEIFLPAGGQGVIALQVRTGDDRLKTLLEPINHFETRLCLRAEREFLRLLQADCNQPIGVRALIARSNLTIQAQVFALHASSPSQATVEGRYEDAEALAAKLLDQINGEQTKEQR